jgi:hypothetical protein
MRGAHPRRSALLAVLGLTLAPASDHARPRAALNPVALDYPLRGVCWEGRGRIGDEALAPLSALGVSWISQTPFGWSRALDDPQVRLATEPRHLWGESDEGLIETARLARARGVRTLLKPHLWVRGGHWVGELKMRDEDDWRAFFASYEVFILHYAVLAEREGFEAFAVGTELRHASRREDDWRRVIARVRSAYSGPLTYCAAWNEAEDVAFWDDLDFVGVQAYYPLRGDPHGDPLELRASWREAAARLEALARRTGRRVVLTEVGYKSLRGSLARPWEWGTEGEVDLGLQSQAFRALFEVLPGRDWFGGTFVWKWHPGIDPRAAPSARRLRDFTPQGKPALDVIAAAYSDWARRAR